jgi:hypothetical protein
VPYALILAGIVLVIAGVRNTHTALFSLLIGDFTGTRSFIWWALSILGIGAVGYVEDLRGLANTFLALVFIVLILANKGVFAQFTAAFQGAIPAAPDGSTTSTASTDQSPLATAAANLAKNGASLAGVK